MSRRQPYLPQRQLGSDVITNNGVDRVVGILNIPFQTPVPAGSIPFVDPNGLQIDWITVIPSSMIVQAKNPNEVEFNYLHQGGF